MKKAELRRQFRQLRKSLPTEEIDIRSRQIAQRFFEQQCTIGNSTIHLFLPILRQHEIDTWPIIDQLWRNFPDVRVAISVTDSETYRLSHYQLTPDTVLAQNRWGHTGAYWPKLDPYSDLNPRPGSGSTPDFRSAGASGWLWWWFLRPFSGRLSP